jgi:hypothetical protein
VLSLLREGRSGAANHAQAPIALAAPVAAPSADAAASPANGD